MTLWKGEKRCGLRNNQTKEIGNPSNLEMTCPIDQAVVMGSYVLLNLQVSSCNRNLQDSVNVALQ